MGVNLWENVFPSPVRRIKPDQSPSLEGGDLYGWELTFHTRPYNFFDFFSRRGLVSTHTLIFFSHFPGKDLYLPKDLYSGLESKYNFPGPQNNE